jgi:hypothetical protein
MNLRELCRTVYGMNDTGYKAFNLLLSYLRKERKKCKEIDEHSSKLALCTVETADCLKGLLTLWQYW